MGALLNYPVGTFDPRDYPGYYTISSCSEGSPTGTARPSKRRTGSCLDLEPARYPKRPAIGFGSWCSLLPQGIPLPGNRSVQAYVRPLQKTKLESAFNGTRGSRGRQPPRPSFQSWHRQVGIGGKTAHALNRTRDLRIMRKRQS
jgi:hypothetical protein